MGKPSPQCVEPEFVGPCFTLPQASPDYLHSAGDFAIHLQPVFPNYAKCTGGGKPNHVSNGKKFRRPVKKMMRALHLVKKENGKVNLKSYKSDVSAWGLVAKKLNWPNTRKTRQQLKNLWLKNKPRHDMRSPAQEGPITLGSQKPEKPSAAKDKGSIPASTLVEVTVDTSEGFPEVAQPAAQRQKNSKETLGVKPASVWDIVQSVHHSVVVAQHGPYLVTSNAILSLLYNKWLPDKVIDAYLYMLSHGRSEILFIPTGTLTPILDGTLKSPNMLLPKNGRIIGVYHQEGVHWTSVVINTKKKEICYYDSYGEKLVIALGLLKNWSKFWFSRKGVSGNFRLIYPEKVPRQEDDYNCGIYALGFLHKQITGHALLKTSLMETRSVIAQQLYEKSDV